MDARTGLLRPPEAPSPEAGATLTIDLGAIRRNYRRLKEMAAPAETAAVIKADAYGCGIEAVAPALQAEGCRTFFVALVSEGVRARAALGDGPRIFVLNGYPPACAETYRKSDLLPVLGSIEEIAAWDAEAGTPAAFHVDTGMNRLGLHPSDLARDDLAASIANRPPVLLMTHMACADEPRHPLNRRQIAAFDEIRARLPEIPASLANSAAIINGWTWNTDLARPGIALFGGRAVSGIENPVEPVVRLDARIIQTRRVRIGETVGYGATWTAQRDSLIAFVSMGYADGYHRSATGGDGRPAGFAALDGRHLPLVGRVSMDLVALDATGLADDEIVRGTTVEMIGPTVSVDDVADAAGTIGYEILTGLGQRYARVVIDSEAG